MTGLTRLYLNTFGVMDSTLINNLTDLGIRGFRVDLLPPSHPEYLDNVRKIQVASRNPQVGWNFIIWGGNFTHPDGTPATDQEFYDLVVTTCESISSMVDPHLLANLAIELGNEPDLAPPPWRLPVHTSLNISHSHRVIRRLLGDEVTVVSPGLSNLDHDSLVWLQTCHLGLYDDFLDHPNTVMGIHRYPVARDPWDSHLGGDNRQEETETLRAIIGSKPYWITECGLTRGPHKKPWPGRWGWLLDKLNPRTEMIPELDHIHLVSQELAYWATQSVDVVTLYQINNSPDPKSREHFGIRDPQLDGSYRFNALGYSLPTTVKLMDDAREAQGGT